MTSSSSEDEFEAEVLDLLPESTIWPAYYPRYPARMWALKRLASGQLNSKDVCELAWALQGLGAGMDDLALQRDSTLDPTLLDSAGPFE